jgi:hypothetical protein
MEIAEVALPHGLDAPNGPSRAAAVRSLSGRDELELMEITGRTSPARRATDLLARCLVRLGGVACPGEEAVRRLIFGDREALLLHLRRHMFGDRISCVVICPEHDCAGRMDVDLTVEQLLDRPVPAPEPILRVSARAGRERYSARFRLPTVGDVEAGADAAASDPGGAARMVLQRCVDSVEIVGADQPVERLPAELVDLIEARMLEADPFAETVISLTCPECGHGFRLLFDPADYLFRELSGLGRGLFVEVHQLALHYHWHESEILDLPRGRRLLYLGLLADTVGAA